MGYLRYLGIGDIGILHVNILVSPNSFNISISQHLCCYLGVKVIFRLLQTNNLVKNVQISYFLFKILKRVVHGLHGFFTDLYPLTHVTQVAKLAH